MSDRKQAPGKETSLDATITTAGPADGAAPGAPTRAQLPGRYEDLGAFARGAFGEVRRVRDTLLDRVLAMKVLHREIAAVPSLRRRFFTEVQITAQLQHPGIVPVYDHGELHDGRLWYAMKEVRGTTLGAIIADLHAASSPAGFGITASGWTFRRVIDAFARITQAVAFAHGRGVVHRDLKPENLMVGELGEALVMDWGLARRVAGPIDDERDVVDSDAVDEPARAELTRHGDVLGTPAYMPPEQARGARDLHGPPSDVYALGAILHHVLTGRPPYAGKGREVLAQILAGPPPAIDEHARGGPPIPAELVRACERAMARDMADRCSAEALARDVLAWLDGVRRREEALAVLEQARQIAPDIARLRAEEERVEAQARTLLGALKPYDAVATKRPAWELEDEAARLGRAAVLVETKWLQIVHGALSVDGELPEAHAMLADHYRAALAAAERAHDEEDAARCEEMLRAHDRGRHTAFLRGDGAVTLVTDPPGAAVALYRHVLSDRRLVEVFERDLGVTPLLRVPVDHGSYILRVRAPGHAEVRVPILVERAGHWYGVAPGDSVPHSIELPEEGALDADDIYVPAGWCWTGGDAEAPDSLPARRIWIDAFVIRRHPVTNREYIEFLNDLVVSGREAEAVAACPRREMGAVEGSEARSVFDRDEAGGFVLPSLAENPAWSPESPAVQVDWYAASAYAAWLSARTGKAWRLLNELEREKAARGVDGRILPWGDHGDATFACVLEGHHGPPTREPVERHLFDESPYGVRGLAGNIRDWCINAWKHEGPLVENQRLRLDPAAAEAPDFRAVRGGYWGAPMINSRSAGRFGSRPQLCRLGVGFRMARSYPESR